MDAVRYSQLLALKPPHALNRVPSYRGGEKKKKFSKKAGQTALMTHRAWPDKCAAYVQPAPSVPFSPQLTHAASSPRSLPFPAFDSGPTHPITSAVQSPNALPLHPTPLRGTNLHVIHKVIQRALPIDSTGQVPYPGNQGSSPLIALRGAGVESFSPVTVSLLCAPLCLWA